MFFENFNFDGFWNDTDYAVKSYVSEKPSEQLIAEIEKELGFKLPESYVWLMQKHNGGVPFNNRYPTHEETSWAQDHIAITGIMGIGREKDNSLGGTFNTRFWIEEWGYPDIGIAFADCPSAGHDMIFFDYRECGRFGEPCIVHVDQENDYKITFLAKDFETFICGLVKEEEY